MRLVRVSRNLIMRRFARASFVSQQGAPRAGEVDFGPEGVSGATYTPTVTRGLKAADCSVIGRACDSARRQGPPEMENSLN